MDAEPIQAAAGPPSGKPVVVGFSDEPLEVKWIDGKHWMILREFDYHASDAKYVLVPTGFVTDFASIPRSLWSFLPPTGTYGKAAVLHDFMYQSGLWTPTGPPCNRGDADRVLRDAMEVLGVPGLQEKVIYMGIRAGGWLQWRRYRAADKQAVSNAS